MSASSARRRREQREAATLDRRQVLEIVCRLRRQRDRCRQAGVMFDRGMGAGYALAAGMIWRELHS